MTNRPTNEQQNFGEEDWVEVDIDVTGYLNDVAYLQNALGQALDEGLTLPGVVRKKTDARNN